jgi:hypothetical protein
LGRAKEFHTAGLTTLTIDFYYGKLPIDNEEVCIPFSFSMDR